MGKVKNKTKKAVAKRFRVTGSGKLITSHAGRRHLALGKNRKRKRQLAMPKAVDEADQARIKACLPFA